MKKKLFRKQRSLKKRRQKGIDIDEYQRQRVSKEEARCRTLESFLEPYSDKWKHKLEIRLVKKGTPEYDESIEESFNLYAKYQKARHKDEATRALFEKYTLGNPFINTEDGVVPSYGTFQQHYLIDEKIVAASVIDILPHRFVSKYCFYDPDYDFLSLGTFLALREIAFVRQLAITRPSLRNYEMEDYIARVPQLSYKDRFRPSEILCPYSYQWVSLDECNTLIQANLYKYVPLRPKIPFPIPNISYAKCKYQGNIYMYHNLRKILDEEKVRLWDGQLQEYFAYEAQVEELQRSYEEKLETANRECEKLRKQASSRNTYVHKGDEGQ